MTYFRGEEEVRTVVGGFLLLFPRLDSILREATGREQMVMKLELSSPRLEAEIDTTLIPLAVRLDAAGEGMLGLSAPASHFHDLLLGRLSLAAGINQKKVIVRGSAARLMKSAPLFYLAPYIYPFYLESIGRSDLIPAGGRTLLHGPAVGEDKMRKMINKLAYMSGYALGWVKKHLRPDLDIVSALEAMGEGLARACPPAAEEKSTSPSQPGGGAGVETPS